MSASTPSNLNADLDANFSLLKQALPIRKRRELLTVLAGFWRDQLQSPHCAVVSEMPGKGEYSAVFKNRDELPEYRLLNDVNFGGEGSEAWRDSCSELFSATFGKSIALQFHGEFLGMILWNSESIPAEPQLVLTALLLTQLREAELLQPNGLGVDWLQRRKQDALIEFAAGAGHEINNPVAAISGRVQLLLRQETDPKRRESLKTIGAQAMRISQMIGDTMQYAEPPPLHLTNCELGQATKTVLEKLNGRLKEQGTQIKLTRPEEVWITADENQLQTTIAELMTNSLNALGQGGVIKITITPPNESVVGFARLEVSDNGPGLSDADRKHLFDPFYSGRQAGRGLGFGLCKCWRIVTAHGGNIEVSSVPWVETAVTTFWPVA